jgi:glycosyltransferase A (GT-A) superfamily protein (DUF2064 family)
MSKTAARELAGLEHVALDDTVLPETQRRFGTVLVIAKEPLPGQVKTRLTPPFSPAQAAELAAAAIADTLAAVRRVSAGSYVLVLEGRAGDWVPTGWRVVAQVAGGLDLRLAAAFAAASGPTVLVGMDTPQVRAEQLAAFRPDRFDACIGLAADGGFWAIGFADPTVAARVIPGVPMSRDDTGARQCERIRDAGLSLQVLDELIDVDTAVEARAVAVSAPHTGFARSWAKINPGNP